jgi:predicted glycogen debranching enzyme
MTDELVRRMPWGGARAPAVDPLLTREWLVANGLGGYASGTVSGVLTRRYHGLLVSALPAPLGRVVMLSHLSEQLRRAHGEFVRFGGEERHGALDARAGHLVEFRLESGLPVWTYAVDGFVLEKRVYMPHLQNTVHVAYRLLEGPHPLRLKLRPSVHFRRHEARVDAPLERPYRVASEQPGRYEVTGRLDGHAASPLRLSIDGSEAAFTIEGRTLEAIRYRQEIARGYEGVGDLWSPGYFRVDVAPGADATLVASTEGWDTVEALAPAHALAAEVERRRRLLAAAHPLAREGVGAELVLAADAFVITPAGRVADAARAHADGDEVRTVIAGYHWFTDWGRDTMISLEGLALATGRFLEAGYILRTFGYYVRDGLIPNLFPDGTTEGLYHTADATLWFFHAIHRYLEATGDRETLRHLLPKLRAIVADHLEGTRFGIRVDARDGLLAQGEKGYQLTWMDAKVGDWVVTPRDGKAVEINALWYNALRLLEGWLREEKDEAAAREIAAHAERARASFNAKFWCEEAGHLYDVIEGSELARDAACRPNQLFAVSLDHPVLARERWERVVDVVRERLLTPVGLRSLAPGHPDYRPKYDGDLRARDAAYHQGTVWAWLVGPYVDAWLKVHPGDLAGARACLDGLAATLGEACIGTISEVFDAEAPFTPRGCVAQAWSVAEALRCWVKTAAEPGAREEGRREHRSEHEREARPGVGGSSAR